MLNLKRFTKFKVLFSYKNSKIMRNIRIEFRDSIGQLLNVIEGLLLEYKSDEIIDFKYFHNGAYYIDTIKITNSIKYDTYDSFNDIFIRVYRAELIKELQKIPTPLVTNQTHS